MRAAIWKIRNTYIAYKEEVVVVVVVVGPLEAKGAGGASCNASCNYTVPVEMVVPKYGLFVPVEIEVYYCYCIQYPFCLFIVYNTATPRCHWG